MSPPPVEMEGGSLSSDKRYNHVLKVIDEHLIPDATAKAERGEVFTPPDLVREMLFGLSKKALQEGNTKIWGLDDAGNFTEANEKDRVGGLPTEVWRNPDLKWLDPANGIGNFPIIAFYKLDYELQHVPKWRDDDKRRKHIIENMLYMMELDKTNVAICKSLFKKIHPDAKPNICCCDSLSMTDEKLMKVFGVNRFDIVMGNPPFQKPKIIGVKGGYGGIGTLWDDFVQYSIKLFRNGESKLVFLHPPGWRKPESDLWDLMTVQNNIEFLRIYPKSQRYFDISQRFDYYILSPTKHEQMFVIDEMNILNKITIKDWPFIPNCRFDLIHNIIVKNKNDGIIVIYNTKYHTSKENVVKKIKDSIHKYPIIHEMNQKGIGYRWTNDNESDQKHFGTKKVILSFNETQYPFNDYKGEYGMSQIAFGIPIKTKEEGDRIVEAINSDEFRQIIAATKWGAFQTDYRMFRYIKPDFWKKFVSNKGGYRKTLVL